MLIKNFIKYCFNDCAIFHKAGAVPLWQITNPTTNSGHSVAANRTKIKTANNLTHWHTQCLNYQTMKKAGPIKVWLFYSDSYLNHTLCEQLAGQNRN
ncbi:hypothetical protein SY86_10935 [Erwinia tracheiphila]|uniref:Uncharacterized protein n=1 Tax=Erwinia tracheiphila TaxID=65700 RepID=A0A0M2KA65_9GAMM|nr:hypothetical protein AV903_05590 [Erwinia tracheiphila]EOS93261.1 hypothetical protein ETR_19993 [Erwinia tracheiphila PSU-1]KKF35824.1 hypothetical protein SY86_10935 [Erwinia tracheiphila]